MAMLEVVKRFAATSYGVVVNVVLVVLMIIADHLHALINVEMFVEVVVVVVITNELKTILDTIPIDELLLYLYTRKSGEACLPLHSNLCYSPNYSKQDLDSDMSYFRNTTSK